MIKIIHISKNINKYKNDITRLIKLAYISSFEDKLITQSFIDNKFYALESYLNNKQCYLLLAKDNQNIIGLCHFFVKNELNQNIGHLNQVAVLKDFQGKRFYRIRGGACEK